MKFLAVTGENFLTLHAPFNFHLKDRGLVLIQGENRVDSSADSNGSGKSSLVDAISWACYGYTARGVSGDSVVNSKVKKGCWVCVELEDDVAIYTIERKRKPNALTLTVLDKATGKSTPLTKGTEKETQEVIDRVLGCSLEVFLAAIYAGQETMPDLPGMTDKQLKLLVEEAAGTSVLANAYALARARLSGAEGDLKLAENTHLTTAANLVSLKDGLAENGRLLAHWNDKRDDNVKRILTEAAAVKSNIDTTSDLIEAADKVGLLKAIDEGKASLASYRADCEKLETIRRDMQMVERVVRSAQSDFDQSNLALQRDESHLEHLMSHDDKCPTCGTPMSEEDRQKRQDRATAAVKQSKEVRDERAAKLKSAEASLAEIREHLTELESKLVKPEELLASQDELSKRLVEVTRLEGVRASYMLELSNKAKQLKAEKEAINPYEAVCAKVEAQIKAVELSLVELKAKVDEKTVRVQVLKDAEKVLGPAGARAQILDTVTPYLNDRTAEYLGALSDGAMSAVWSTLGTTAKGELREKFNIEVTNTNGSESFEGLSGGEKRKARLACYMALQDLVATRASKPIDLFVADEIDHALDQAGLERLMAILETKARERGTVLVVSHNSLSDWIDTVVTVVKTDAKTSHIEGATT